MSTYTTEEIYYWVAKNVLFLGKKNVNEEEIKIFTEENFDLIKEIVSHMPRGMTSIGAAVAKCALLYDKQKAINFLKNSKERIFQGKEDPVYHFHLWLHGLKGPKRKKHDVSTYQITFYACKNYCMGNKIKRLRSAKEPTTQKKESKIPKDSDVVEEFMNKIKNQEISANDLRGFIAAFQKKKKPSSNFIKSS